MEKQQEIVFHNKDVKKLLEQNGVVEKGNFTLKSGKTSKIYISKHKIFANFELFDPVLNYLTLTIMFGPKTENFDIIVGPADGGTILAAALAGTLKKDFAFAGEIGGGFYLAGEYRDRIKGRKVLIVDDIVTTGGTIKKVVSAVEAAGGEVVAAVCIWNRSGETELNGTTIYSTVLERIDE